MNRPFAVAGFTVFFIIGLFFDAETEATQAAFICFAVALVIALFVAKLRRIRQLPVALASGALAMAMLISATNYIYLPLAGYDGKTLHLKATLTDNGEYEYGRYYFTAESVEIGGETVEADVRLVFKTRPDAEPYDTVEGDFTFYRPGISSDGALSHNRANGVFLGAYPTEEVRVVNVNEAEKPFGYKLFCCRQSIKNAVFRTLPDERGALAVAMIMGDKSEIPPSLYADMRIAGLTHIICVSGLHVSLWANLIRSILLKTRLKKLYVNLFAALGVIFFTAIAGFTYSSVRAGIMMLVYLASDAFLRRNDSFNSLGIALLVMTCINPFSMGSLSLQLSTLSTAGVIFYGQYIEPVVSDFLFRKFRGKRLRKLLSSLFSSYGITVCASLMTLPLIYKFNCSVGLQAMLSNVLIVPLTGPCMVLCAVGAAVFSLFGLKSNVFSFLGGLFCKAIIGFSEFISDFDILTLRTDNDKLELIFCGVMLFVIVSLILGFKGKVRPFVSVVLSFAILISSTMIAAYSERRETRIEVIDTGNGVAVLFTHDAENILVNCGGSDFFSSSRIAEAIDDCFGKINCLVLTDNSDSSVSEAVDILKNYKPLTLMSGETGREISLLTDSAERVDIKGSYISKNFTVTGVETDGRMCVTVKTNDVTVFVSPHPIHKSPDADVFIFRGDYPSDLTCSDCSFAVVCAENLRGVAIQNELINGGVNACATAENGNVIIRAYNGDISAYRKDG